MSDEWQPSGVWDAVLIDVLLDAGLNVESVSAMSAQDRIDAIRSAAKAAQLDDSTIEMLRDLGVLQD